MSRDLSAAMQTAVAAPIVRPVLIGRLDIKDDPVTAWTGPGIFAPTATGDAALDGETFDPLGPFVDVSDIHEDQSMGEPVVIRLHGHDIDETLLRQVVRDKRVWRGRKAWLWMGLLDSDNFTIIANPARIKTGVISRMEIRRREGESIVDVAIDDDRANSRSGPFRWVDHVRFHAADTFSAHVIKLANKARGLEDSDVRGRTISEATQREIDNFNPESNRFNQF